MLGDLFVEDSFHFAGGYRASMIAELPMPVHYFAVLVFFLAAIVFIAVSLILPRLFRPINPYPEKVSGYECGERPIGTPWIRFNIRFYIIAILFIIFDVEVLFVAPWAVVFKKLLRDPQVGMLVFYEMFVFLLVLGIGLVYCWVKGHLEWVFRGKNSKTGLRSVSPQS